MARADDGLDIKLRSVIGEPIWSPMTIAAVLAEIAQKGLVIEDSYGRTFKVRLNNNDVTTGDEPARTRGW